MAEGGNIADYLPKISYEDESVRKVSPFSDDDTCKTRATLVGEINVRSPGDAFEGGVITGSAVLSKYRLIVTDCYNTRVKLVDIGSGTVISKLTVSSIPWDVTTLSPTQAAVTLSDQQKILLLKVKNNMAIERQLTVHGDCRGIAYNQNRLLVSFFSNPRLEIIDMTGHVIRTIENDSDGRKLFKRPEYVCVSKDSETIYVSDNLRNSVTSLTFDGVVASVFTDDKALSRPKKLCTDHYGNVYTCCWGSQNVRGSRNVHMITAGFKKALLTEADGLNENLMSVSHCQDTHRLFIGMVDVNVKVYQLKYYHEQ